MAHSSELYELAKNIGFKISQVNGCRRFGPYHDHENYLPPKGSEVFVGMIPPDCFENELFPFFNQVGYVYEIRLMMTFLGMNRTYGFVRFYDAETAKKAVAVLDETQIRPGAKPLVIRPSTDHSTLMLVGVRPGAVSVEKLQEVLQTCCEDLQEVVARPPVFLLYFGSHRGAAVTKRNFSRSNLPAHWGSHVNILWEPNPAVMRRFREKKERIAVKQAVSIYGNVAYNYQNLKLDSTNNSNPLKELTDGSELKENRPSNSMGAAASTSSLFMPTGHIYQMGTSVNNSLAEFQGPKTLNPRPIQGQGTMLTSLKSLRFNQLEISWK